MLARFEEVEKLRKEDFRWSGKLMSLEEDRRNVPTPRKKTRGVINVHDNIEVETHYVARVTGSATTAIVTVAHPRKGEDHAWRPDSSSSGEDPRSAQPYLDVEKKSCKDNYFFLDALAFFAVSRSRISEINVLENSKRMSSSSLRYQVTPNYIKCRFCRNPSQVTNTLQDEKSA